MPVLDKNDKDAVARYNEFVRNSPFTHAMQDMNWADVKNNWTSNYIYIEEDGSITVADYKTDRIYGEGAVAEFKERHKQQLSYYKKAVERICLKHVGKCELYSFCLGRSIVL